MNNNIKELQTSVAISLIIKIEINEKNFNIEEKFKLKDKRIALIERKIRGGNIIIYGISEDREINITAKILQFFKNTLKIEDITVHDIEEVRRLGKSRENVIRPVKVEFSSKRKKSEVLKNVKNLKETKIRIDEDYPQEVITERRKLISHMKIAKTKGYNAYLKYNKLIVNGKVYKSDDFESGGLFYFNE